MTVAVVTFAPFARVPPPLLALRRFADASGQVGVSVDLAGRAWPSITNAWPAFAGVTIRPSGTRWHGPITSEGARLVERAIGPWALSA